MSASVQSVTPLTRVPAQRVSVAATSAIAARDAAFAKAAPAPKGSDDDNEKLDFEPGQHAKWESWLSDVWPKQKEAASRMIVVPEPGSPALRVAYYYYHSSKGMDGWLDGQPKDGKLALRVLTCVSYHDGPARAETFAKSNTYVATVTGPTGTQRFTFGPGVSKETEHTSSTGVITIDVSKPGDYVIECAPLGSAGVMGYVEGRRLTIHVGR